jgi:hypothetical protein
MEYLTTLPAEIGQLSQLEILDLSDCKALEKLPDTLLKLTKLRRLALRGTKLQAFQVLEDGGKECWTVALNDTQINRAQASNDRSPIFSGIDQIMLVSRDFSGTLDLSNSSLSQLPEEIYRLHKLTALDISNNNNLREVPPDLWECGNLKEVNIVYCGYSAKLLGSLDSTFNSKKVKWEDRPPYVPKLLIKFVTCAALLATAIFTIHNLIIKSKNESCDELCDESCNNLKDDCQICLTVCGILSRREKLAMDQLSEFKYFVTALSIFLLSPMWWTWET